MQKVKMFCALAISMASFTVNALIVDDSSLKFSLGNDASLKYSINTSNQSGNVLHNIIRNIEDETLILRIEAYVNIGSMVKEEKEKMLQYPHNMFADDLIARGFYAQDMVEYLVEDIMSNANDLRELLLEKDSDGKTPIDLLSESKRFSSTDFEKMCKEFVAEEPESPEEKQARLEERSKEKRIELAAALLLHGKTN
jgi:hypothetical protein